jgi:hypothetical protein
VSRISLVDKVLAIDEALRSVPDAFGGALALAYHAEPRATIDIAVNVSVPVDRADEVFEPLDPLGADTDDAFLLAGRDGQVRVMWDETPIDLFFSYDPFHIAAGHSTVEVPFAGHTIRVLSADHLTVCKVVFNRSKDWVDIEAMIGLGTHIDTAEVVRWVGRIAALLSATG